MAWTDLPTNYKDAKWSGNRKYRMTNNSDGTVSFADETVYETTEDTFFGAADANAMNSAMNEIMSNVTDLTSIKSTVEQIKEGTLTSLTVNGKVTGNNASFGPTNINSAGSMAAEISASDTMYHRLTNSTNSVEMRNGGGNIGLYHTNTKGYKTSGYLVVMSSDGNIKVNTTSDKRSKNYIEDLNTEKTHALLSEVKPITFTYKGDTNGDTVDGFFAQDLRDVMIRNNIGYKGYLIISPNDDEEHDFIYDLNANEDDVNYGIDYSKLVPILWKGWQIHEQQINELKAEVEFLKSIIIK